MSKSSGSIDKPAYIGNISIISPIRTLVQCHMSAEPPFTGEYCTIMATQRNIMETFALFRKSTPDFGLKKKKKKKSVNEAELSTDRHFPATTSNSYKYLICLETYAAQSSTA